MRPRAWVLRHLPQIDAHVGIEDGQLEGVLGTMHEAGLAVAIADALRPEGIERGHAHVRSERIDIELVRPDVDDP